MCCQHSAQVDDSLCVCVCMQVDVAKKIGFSPETVLGHLASAMEKGYFVDYRRGTCTCVCPNVYQVPHTCAIYVAHNYTYTTKWHACS